ncbi:hypothetical protein V6C16_12765, partial [Desulfovibrio sp. 1188_IL3213]|uniref:hypothetical protein n=1 Tax=Desulfovibrio sp. 1188_IL3213 TaxID=3084052 RepID=UPI002FDB2F56
GRLFGKRVRIHGHNAGLHLLLEFPAGPDETRLTAKAAACGVRTGFPFQAGTPATIAAHTLGGGGRAVNV